jgi:hypothetical protein
MNELYDITISDCHIDDDIPDSIPGSTNLTWEEVGEWFTPPCGDWHFNVIRQRDSAIVMRGTTHYET